jgi:DsbC/DsbD-like thiol-disulfide interchange protein
METSNFMPRGSLRRLSLLFLAFSASVFGQTPGQNVVHLVPPSTVTARAGATVRVALSVQVDEGFHVNSNTPADQFLIPLRLTWSPGPIESAGVAFPRPRLEKYSFSEKPVSVFTGNFDIVTRFKVPAGAAPGTSAITGKLHYQACNDKNCLTPRTVEVTLPVEIVK